MKNYAYRDKEEYTCIPYVVKQDRRLKRKLHKEFKDTCRIITLTWMIFLAFAVPLMISDTALATACGLIILASAILDVLGW